MRPWSSLKYKGPLFYESDDDVLYRNEGDGTFADVTVASGVAAANFYYGLGVVPEDYDGDGDLDIFVANDETANVLFRNDGGAFVDIAVEAGVAYNGDGEPESGMGVDAADADVTRRIVEGMRSSLGLGVTVSVEPTGSVPRSEGGKLSRTDDRRKL